MAAWDHTCSNDIPRSRMMHTSYKKHSVDKITRGIYLVKTMPILNNFKFAT